MGSKISARVNKEKEFLHNTAYTKNNVRPTGENEARMSNTSENDNDAINVIYDLTFEATVYLTSPIRATCWPMANTSYLFDIDNMRERQGLWTGSGMVREVNKIANRVRQDKVAKKLTKCSCRKCEHSHSPSNVWWEFNMITTTTVVIDDTDASHTTLILVNNSDMCLVVSISKVSIEQGYCQLNCATCDKNIGDKLEKMWKHYLDVFGIVA